MASDAKMPESGEAAAQDVDELAPKCATSEEVPVTDTITEATDRDAAEGDQDGGPDDASAVSQQPDEELVDESSVEPATGVEEVAEPTVPKEDDWLLILGHERLKKRVLKKGNGIETRPRPRDIVTVKLSGRLADDTVVDQHDSLVLSVGDGDSIQALDLAISLMECGEVAEVYTEAQFAYGHAGREGDIPSDASITYTVELLSREEPPDVATLPFSERIKQGDKKRERGNYYYSRGDFSSAIHSYTRALDILSLEGSAKEDDESMQKLTDLRLKCYSNIAAAQLKVEAWDSCISSCDQVLRTQSDNVKALFRKGKALASKGELDKAIATLRSALQLEPDSKIVHQEMSKLVRKRTALLDKEKNMYKRMIGTDKSSFDSGATNPNKGGSKWKLLTAGAVLAGVLSVGISVYRLYHF